MLFCVFLCFVLSLCNCLFLVRFDGSLSEFFPFRNRTVLSEPVNLYECVFKPLFFVKLFYLTIFILNSLHWFSPYIIWTRKIYDGSFLVPFSTDYLHQDS